VSGFILVVLAVALLVAGVADWRDPALFDRWFEVAAPGRSEDARPHGKLISQRMHVCADARV
jgi:hypothetical protein